MHRACSNVSMKRVSSAQRQAHQLTTKVPRQPILVAEKWRRFFFFTLHEDRSALCASMCCPAACNSCSRATSVSWLRHCHMFSVAVCRHLHSCCVLSPHTTVSITMPLPCTGGGHSGHLSAGHTVCRFLIWIHPAVSYVPQSEHYKHQSGDMKQVLEWRIAIHPLQVIGSSLLFVYDSSNQNSVHMIDFGKTIEVHPGIRVDHRSTWEEGNHEDGYLWGLDNLISMWQDL